MKLEDAYAEALFGELQDKDAVKREKTLKRFFALVTRKGHTRLLNRIGKSLEHIENREEKRKTVTISLGKEGKEIISKEVEAQFKKNNPEATFVACEDETLIGGYVASGLGLRVDRSHKSALLSLYERIKI